MSGCPFAGTRELRIALVLAFDDEFSATGLVEPRA